MADLICIFILIAASTSYCRMGTRLRGSWRRFAVLRAPAMKGKQARFLSGVYRMKHVHGYLVAIAVVLPAIVCPGYLSVNSGGQAHNQGSPCHPAVNLQNSSGIPVVRTSENSKHRSS